MTKKIAKIFTKELGRVKFEKFKMMLGLTNTPSTYGGNVGHI